MICGNCEIGQDDSIPTLEDLKSRSVRCESCGRIFPLSEEDIVKSLISLTERVMKLEEKVCDQK